MKTFYLVACVAGTALPYIPLVLWIADNGIDLTQFARDVLDHRLGLMAWTDVVVSAVVLLQFASDEGTRLGIRRLWIVPVATITVGVSLGLPLFLLLRETRLRERHREAIA